MSQPSKQYPESKRAWTERNRDRVRASKRKYNAAHRERIRAWERANPDKVKASRENWIAKNPEKRKAQIAVGNALRDGRLRRLPCLVCGNPKTQAHHTDYSRPLDVLWLCTKHHGSVTRKSQEEIIFESMIGLS